MIHNLYVILFIRHVHAYDYPRTTHVQLYNTRGACDVHDTPDKFYFIRYMFKSCIYIPSERCTRDVVAITLYSILYNAWLFKRISYDRLRTPFHAGCLSHTIQ